jgi:VWFA-related protein
MPTLSLRAARILIGPILATALSLAPTSDGHVDAQFRVRADAVRVDVLVRDGRRNVAGLRASDFELRDNGVVQQIAQLEIEAMPLNVINVYDVSASVRGTAMADLREASEAVIDELRPVDRAALLAFSDDLRLVSDLSHDMGAIKAGLSTLTTGGRTRLRDAVFAGMALRDEGLGRTLVLVFSDGYDTASWIERRDVIEVAQRADVVIYPVFIDRAEVSRKRSLPFLKELASETGGRVVPAASTDRLQRAFAEILDEFRQRYVLSYSPAPASPGWHRIDVSLKRRKGAVTARRGYFLD